jgi:hypothetical protein
VKKIPCAIWFETIRCWTDAGECNDDTPIQEPLGIFPTEDEAVEVGEGKKIGQRLTDAEYEQFCRRSGPDGFYVHKHLVVFTSRKRSIGHPVNTARVLELTSSKESRNRTLLRRAKQAGLSAHQVVLEKVP